MALKLSEVLTNKQWLKDAGDAAYSLALHLFNRDTLAVQFEEVIISTYNGDKDISKITAWNDEKER